MINKFVIYKGANPSTQHEKMDSESQALNTVKILEREREVNNTGKKTEEQDTKPWTVQRRRYAQL